MQISTLVRSARAPFLVLTPICILLAYAISALSVSSPNLADTLLVLLGALAAHIAVNQLNEYQDFQSGLDLATKRTPFSGGSGALPEDPQGAGQVLVSSIVSIAIVCWVGIHFLWAGGSMILLPMGLSGIALIIAYTRYVNRMPWICLLAPGYGFGTLMVLCSVLILAGEISLNAALLSAIPFFQVNNLLLLNQFPDIDADRSVGRNHFPIAYGTRASAWAYSAFMLLPFTIIVLLIANGSLPMLCLIALLPVVLGIKVAMAVFQFGGDISQHPQFLGMNVIMTLITPLLLAITMILG